MEDSPKMSTTSKIFVTVAIVFAAVNFVDLNRPGFRRHLAAINYGLGGGGYEYETLHG